MELTMNRIVLVCFLSVTAIAKSEPPTAYGPPSAPGQSYGPPGQGGGGHGGYEEPQAYEFGYRVKDDYSGSSFHQKEESDGNLVRGEYKVALPDGRTQIVTYWADWKTGFHADVKYEGQATYPEQTKSQYGPPSTGGGGGGYNYPGPSSRGGGGYNYPGPSSKYGAPH